jgi:branched-subunit amino acid aminotransferase/4-amino-4-deoxychorismate lyase
VQSIDPEAEPLLHDPILNSVLETPSANLLAVIGSMVAVPPADDILPGISMRTTLGFAGRLGLQVIERPISFEQLCEASEVFLTNSTFCIAPVNWVNGYSFPRRGPILTRLQAEWTRLVGVEIGRPAS